MVIYGGRQVDTRVCHASRVREGMVLFGQAFFLLTGLFSEEATYGNIFGGPLMFYCIVYSLYAAG